MISQHQVSEVLLSAIEIIEDNFTKHYSDDPLDEEQLNGYLALHLADELQEAAESNEVIYADSTPYKNMEEKKTGADFGIRYQLATDDYLIESGFIAQAKKETNYDGNLPLQCFKMLSRTGESYIFQYTTSGIYVYPARPIYYDNGYGGKFTKYYEMPFVTFFKGFFEGFFGEPTIAKDIDKPSSVDPVGARIKYLLDVKIATEEIRFEEEVFNYIGEGYRRITSNERRDF